MHVSETQVAALLVFSTAVKDFCLLQACRSDAVMEIGFRFIVDVITLN